MTDEDFEAGIAALDEALKLLEVERRAEREEETIAQELAGEGNPFASESAPRFGEPFDGYPGGFSLS